jgi:hypothetical protein
MLRCPLLLLDFVPPDFVLMGPAGLWELTSEDVVLLSCDQSELSASVALRRC